MLNDPFLQNPTPDSVAVVWFTEFEGTAHWLELGQPVETTLSATSRKLNRLREDEFSYTLQTYDRLTPRPVWRHEVTVSGLKANQVLPYRVVSQQGEQSQRSDWFTLQSSPAGGQPLNILLTSDHQLMPMVAANIQQAAAVYGQFDAVFHAGDLVNVPDRASEWFDDRRGRSFFPVLQGKASVQLGDTLYQGAAIVQNTPLFPCIGNHEVMGRYSETDPLHLQYKNAQPRAVAEENYLTQGFQADSKATFADRGLNTDVADQWLTDHSFNFQTYQDIFTLPPTTAPQQQYYAVTFGDIRLIALMVTNVWRSHRDPLRGAPEENPKIAGRYQESETQLTQPETWGHGQFIFEPITPESPQYQWLQTELKSPEFQRAKYKIVMFHHPPHSLGGNITPPYTDPQAYEEYAPDGTMRHRRYHYPKQDDYIIRDLIPLLENAGVQLVFYGHSHLWNRFQSPTGMHFLETSNVGNSYGAHVGDNPRKLPAFVDIGNDIPLGNPNGLDPIIPTVAPLTDQDGQPLPYLASNEITVFSVLETATGTIKSYYFPTRQADAPVTLFDQFTLGQD
ncbi:MAG: metallophosphoesterase family protein [Synechocystis sp.]|nr:metallophosphoesterase family protein [Synechocystis sp.]